jgi:dihydroorotate dehydrogenase (fumarate)
MQPDLDLEHLELRPEIVLSTSWESRLPLRWIAILAGRVEASLAATTGAHSAADVLKLLMGGADAVCMASALLRREPSHLEGVLEAMRVWMAENGYTSVAQLKGSMSYRNSPDPAALERANYMKTLTSYSGKVI